MGPKSRTKPFGERGTETVTPAELAGEITTGVELSRVPAKDAVPPK